MYDDEDDENFLYKLTPKGELEFQKVLSSLGASVFGLRAESGSCPGGRQLHELKRSCARVARPTK